MTGAGLMPDLDGLTIFAGQDAYAHWHHLLTHGVVAAAVTAGVLGACANQRLKVGLLCLVAFHLHLLCDLAGSGVGWPISYWMPFSQATIEWSGGWELGSWQNSLIGLGTTLLCLACAVPFGRTMVELISVRADAPVVKAIRARFALAGR